MEEKVVKDVYEAPWTRVCGVFLEGTVAESYAPRFDGDVKYVDYDDDVEVFTKDGADVVVL
jgi:hypothetical protein